MSSLFVERFSCSLDDAEGMVDRTNQETFVGILCQRALTRTQTHTFKGQEKSRHLGMVYAQGKLRGQKSHIKITGGFSNQCTLHHFRCDSCTTILVC